MAENPSLKEIVQPENDLKNMLVEYTGAALNPENQLVTLEMVIDVVAKDFPEFVLALAEENWIRGYQQGLEDVDAGMKIVEKNEKRSCKLCEE